MTVYLDAEREAQADLDDIIRRHGLADDVASELRGAFQHGMQCARQNGRMAVPLRGATEATPRPLLSPSSL